MVARVIVLLLWLAAGVAASAAYFDHAGGNLYSASSLICAAAGAIIYVRATPRRVATVVEDNNEEQAEPQALVDNSLTEPLEAAIFVCTPDTRVLYANRAARRLFGFAETHDQTLLALTLCYDLHRHVSEAVEKGFEQVNELTLPFPAGATVMVHAWPDNPQEPTRWFIEMRDVTPLRRLEQLRRDLVANVSHELRTPLSSIRAMAETILDDPDIEPLMRERWLLTIKQETERLTRIADDLLVLTSAESHPPEKSPMDLAEVVREVVSRLGPRAEEAKLKLITDFPESLEINANQDQMQQVVLNLVDNAIKYTPEGEVRITGSSDKRYVTLSIADTGIGILSEHLSRLFERFYRVDKARSRATGGTGLGLSIVKHIVESHGGHVTVSSEFRRGSTFTVRLPVG